MTLETNKLQSSEIARSMTNSTLDYPLTTAMFSEAVATNQLSSFFNNLTKNNHLNILPRNIVLEKRGKESLLLASLSINFFENRLVTCFQGKEKSIKLSCALGIISDLSELFAKIQASSKTTDTVNPLTIEDEFIKALDNIEYTTSDITLTIDGKAAIAVYPLAGRIVLTTIRGQSSIPLSMMQNCAHLFNLKFAQNICPLLGLDENVPSLLSGITKLYLGRCILGLGKSMATEYYNETKHLRELSRIISLLKAPGSAFYTEPIL